MLDSRKPLKVFEQGMSQISFQQDDSGNDMEDGLDLAESRGRRTS